MIVEHESARRFADAMADVGGVILQETLADEMVQQLLEESEKEAGDGE